MGCAASDIRAELFTAAAAGDAERFDDYWGVAKQEPDWEILGENEEGLSLLQVACRSGSLSITQQLLAYATGTLDAHARNSFFNKGHADGTAAVALAGLAGHEQVVQLLLEAPVHTSASICAALEAVKGEAAIRCREIVCERFRRERLFEALALNDVQAADSILCEVPNGRLFEESPLFLSPLRYAIENCGGNMTALMLVRGAPATKVFKSNGHTPILTACNWLSQNLCAASSLSALLEWGWRDTVDEASHQANASCDPALAIPMGEDSSVAELQSAMKRWLERRRAGVEKWEEGRVRFEDASQEQTFSSMIELCSEEVADMLSVSRVSQRVFDPQSSAVVWHRVQEKDQVLLEQSGAAANRASIWTKWRMESERTA